jgi:hypothetical protein
MKPAWMNSNGSPLICARCPTKMPICAPANWRASSICAGSNGSGGLFRADVPAGCNVGIWTLLSGLARGSLIREDLGYFSFPWFDYLTEQGY